VVADLFSPCAISADLQEWNRRILDISGVSMTEAKTTDYIAEKYRNLDTERAKMLQNGIVLTMLL